MTIALVVPANPTVSVAGRPSLATVVPTNRRGNAATNFSEKLIWLIWLHFLKQDYFLALLFAAI